MAKTLVLAEKPSVGRELGRVLGASRGGEGYLENGQYIVTWALGHLVTLADPEDYDAKYKTWNMEDLPMLPEKRKLTVIRETSRQFRVVQGLLKRPDVGELVIATDAGREGEDPGKSRLAGEDPPPLDLLPDGQGHQGGLPEPASRLGVRRPLPLRRGPEPGGLVRGPQRDQGPHLPLRGLPLRRAGADPHPQPAGGAGEGDPGVCAQGILQRFRQDRPGFRRPVPGQ